MDSDGVTIAAGCSTLFRSELSILRTEQMHGVLIRRRPWISAAARVRACARRE